MAKRPISLTIVAWIVVILGAISLIGAVAIGMLPNGAETVAKMHMSMNAYRLLGLVGAVVSFVCAYGILKGLPWSRVLYLLWSVIGLVIGFYTTPQKALLLVNLVILIVFAFFLFRENANDWFQARGFMLKREVAPSERR